MLLFVFCTIQNTLLYLGIVTYICLIDTTDMTAASPNDKRMVMACFLAQLVINVAQVGITIGHYLYAASDAGSEISSIEAVLDSLYRSWLIYFGIWKMKFLWRKMQRWECGVFVYSQSFQLLSERSSTASRSWGNKGKSFTDIMIFERSGRCITEDHRYSAASFTSAMSAHLLDEDQQTEAGGAAAGREASVDGDGR